MYSVRSIRDFSAHAQQYVLFLTAFLIPVHIRFTGGAIAVLILMQLLQRENFRMERKTAMFFVSLSALYVVYLFGMIYTQNLAVGWQKAELRISMLIFPWIFLTTDIKKRQVDLAMACFVAGGFFVSLIMLVNATLTLLQTGENIFHSSSLSFKGGLSASYMAVYFSFMMVWLFWNWISEKLPVWPKIISASLFLLFFVMLVLLDSRIAFVVLIIACALITILKVQEGKITARQILFPIVIIVITIVTVFAIPLSGERFTDLIMQWNKPYNNAHPTGVNMRKASWATSVDLISQHPFSGVGTGDADDALFEGYREKNLEWPFNDHLNSHNQFLQTTLSLGIIGLIALMTLFCVSLRIAIISGNKFYLAFLIIILIFSLTESIFETEGGVIFFSFFNSMFASMSLRHSNEKFE